MEEKVLKARKEAIEAKKNQEEIKIILENNFLFSGQYPFDILNQYSNSVSDLKKKTKKFTDSSDVFHKCVKHLQRLLDQK